jgi:hypothetical protein
VAHLEGVMRIDRRLLGWGVFFVLLGAIPLALRAGLVSRDLLDDWFLLWPIAVIGWGLGLVLLKTPIAWIGGAVTAITFGIMGGSAIATGFGGLQGASGCGGNGSGTAFAERTGDLGATANATIDFSCGTLSVATTDGTAWTVNGTDRDGRGPRITSDGATVDLRRTEDGGFDAGRTSWNLVLPKTPSLALGLRFNAGSGTIDLAGANISSFSATVNAGSLTSDLSAAAQLGGVDATVNAGSAAISLPGGGRAVDLSLNAGSLDLCLPPGTAIEVDWNGTLASHNLDDLGFTEADDGTWVSPGIRELGGPLTRVTVNASAGSFELQLGGMCRA